MAVVRLDRGNEEARLSKDSSEIRWICQIRRRFVGRFVGLVELVEFVNGSVIRTLPPA